MTSPDLSNSDSPLKDDLQYRAGQLKKWAHYSFGGMIRLFLPAFVLLMFRPVMLRYMPEPQFGWLLFGVFCFGVYWTHIYGKQF